MYGSAERQRALSITGSSPRKKFRSKSANLHATMSPCSRGAISRTLRLDLLRPSLNLCHRQRTCAFKLPLGIAPSAVFSLRRQTRNTHRSLSTTRLQSQLATTQDLTDVLPVCCPGCGAFTQTVEPNEPGFYSKSRKQTRKLLASKKDAIEQENAESEAKDNAITDEEVLVDSLQQQREADQWPAPKPIHEHAALPEESISPTLHTLESRTRTAHVCDRCHDLIHHNKAVSAPKPTIFSIQEFLKESPYKNNRVYHIIDAADFPMSLVPRIHAALEVQGQRSRNRRSPTEKYIGGRKLPTLSFIITRSDLLAATKEQVDSKMEYVRSVLRTALGRTGKDARLGNVHMISAHRGWWTKQVKEDIREHGGGIWVVGKANVGKSSFIEACFPKDSRSLENMAELIEQLREENEIPNQREASLFDPESLLPPAPREDVFPVLPVVSSLPGTTVSPIRIPFGRGKGEVIDLPGLERSQLEDYVQDQHKRDLIMTKRIKPDRCTLKPGQSLLLGGGLVRITAVNPEHTVLAACFVPIESHVTKTEKAIEMQTEQKAYPGTVLMKEGTGGIMSSAGKFDLKWDITESNLPSTVAKAVKDKGIPIPPLPYRVMSTDILIEGCGWVELSVQVRAKRNSEAESTIYPQIEVFTPKGEHIGSRPPMECWNFIAEKLKADRRKRPRSRYRYR
ncbi:uncharacterized protein N7459_010001 [Penicillium hispanicum]|uniref:uncharacterized protein n=1 Tax=Penicillium hispanicum TaxID=1080232 RepID=UPI00254269C9|nr:uncharacterized protein N7459_010001 [Penicillium hispanicum]KAJ5570571.1 hypothetical protein N7459_010001 [Penicillium hispanicum]